MTALVGAFEFLAELLCSNSIQLLEHNFGIMTQRALRPNQAYYCPRVITRAQRLPALHPDGWAAAKLNIRAPLARTVRRAGAAGRSMSEPRTSRSGPRLGRDAHSRIAHAQ